MRLGRPRSRSGRRGEEKILFLPRLELRPSGRPARIQSLCRLRYMTWLPCDSTVFRATELNEQKVLEDGVSETSTIIRTDLNAEINGLIPRTARNGQTGTEVGLCFSLLVSQETKFYHNKRSVLRDINIWTDSCDASSLWLIYVVILNWPTVLPEPTFSHTFADHKLIKCLNCNSQTKRKSLYLKNDCSSTYTSQCIHYEHSYDIYRLGIHLQHIPTNLDVLNSSGRNVIQIHCWRS
jgi:hypothetical protein